MTTLDVRIGQLAHRGGAVPGRQGRAGEHPVPARHADPGHRAAPGRRARRGGRTVARQRRRDLLQTRPDRSLPKIPVRSLRAGAQVTDRATLDALALLSRPPSPAGHGSRRSPELAHGLVAQLRSGPSIYFGDGSDLSAKWAAATEVLADPSSVGATYIDVTDPSRPAAGASPQAVAAAGLATSGTDGTTSTSGRRRARTRRPRARRINDLDRLYGRLTLN